MRIGKGRGLKAAVVMAGLAICGVVQGAVEFVTVSHVGNAADTTGHGAVDYEYAVSKYEIKSSQLWSAYNADNRISDTAVVNSGDKPASGVSWFVAAKYCNWLTSGDAYSGVYRFDAGGTFLGVDRDAALLSYETVYALPLEDEWYKVAYYTGSGYSFYAFGTNTAPVVGTEANYGLSVVSAWVVGSGVAEQNGTFDMMGNNWEWLETADGSSRLMRGGASNTGDGWLKSTSILNAKDPSLNNNPYGFRVVELTPSARTYVTVGNVGNAADAIGYGAVNYEYAVSKYETTIVEFQTAVADDSRVGTVVNTGDGSHPAAGISWYEAAKYCNWLTSGNAYAGAYQFDESGVFQGVDRVSALSSYTNVYVLPTQDEWYKAAYYTGSDYSLYAFGTNVVPVAGTEANYDTGGLNPWVIGTGSVEQNGTFDMMGNNWEWLETAVGENRVLRGGASNTGAGWLSSANSDNKAPTAENTPYGFRVVELNAAILPALLDYAAIGGVGNDADTTGYGAVSYEYSIGKYEITVGEFQTAVADDSRVGSVVDTGSESHPASGIGWYEAAKYCNWLTSGDAYAGAYSFDESGIFLGVDRVAAQATYTNVYVLPTQDEWYKAAYYTGSGYSLYAFGTNTVPVAGTEANYNTGGLNPWDVGSGAMEQNGTFDMMGNNWEWLETAVGENRALRGGASNTGDGWLSSADFDNKAPTAENTPYGFRVVELTSEPLPVLPELGTVGISVEGSSVVLNWDGQSFVTYTVQSKSNLTDTGWSNVVEDIFGIDGMQYATNAVVASQTFFRIVGE